jgi:hypothetical protein
MNVQTSGSEGQTATLELKSQISDIRGSSWLTQAKKEWEFEEKRRAFRMEMVGGPLAFFG